MFTASATATTCTKITIIVFIKKTVKKQHIINNKYYTKDNNS